MERIFQDPGISPREQIHRSESKSKEEGADTKDKGRENLFNNVIEEN